MTQSRIVRLCALWGLCLFPGLIYAANCSGLPTSFTGGEFPSGDFFSNFDNSCYTINLTTGNGITEYGDLNARYYQLYYQVDPRYELILVGTFPNARYYSVTLYDEHMAVAQTMLDANMAPLTSEYVNPFRPGVAFAAGQQFALPIRFGGTPGKQETGCMMNGYNVSANALDGTRRHAGMDWNSDSGIFTLSPGFPSHVIDSPRHGIPNKGGIVMIRAYLDDTPASDATNPHIIVRDVASGCAYPADYVMNTMHIVAGGSANGGDWIDHTQTALHNTYESDYLPKLCEGNSPGSANRLAWSRVGAYVPITNPDASYISAGVPAGLPDTLAAAGEVMRVRVRVPGTPPTPCTNGCSRSGTEPMRYMSLSFQNADGTVLASVADSSFVKDANGYATLIVGTGAPIPPWITPANGYTVLNLTARPKYEQLSLLAMRHIIPAAGFTCAGQNVPYRMNVATPDGSLMSDYLPVVDYPAAASLPTTAAPLIGPSACNSFPAGQPGVRPNCAVLAAGSPAIDNVVTQCYAAGCDRFAAQAQPPVAIAGSNFGVFPAGLPFTGTSDYVRIVNTTRSWSAGYTGDACTVSISSWESGLIQLVANLNGKAGCPIVPGDRLYVDVWNPQTMVRATTSLIARY
ncbi:MAG TPA: hypothetical protein VMI94_04230 [Bryobacteraceae bacterium]|nr:hypothetical protein [Bryobacteraceae bacterium]